MRQAEIHTYACSQSVIIQRTELGLSARVYVCMYVCMCTHTCMCMRMSMRECVCTRMCVSIL